MFWLVTTMYTYIGKYIAKELCVTDTSKNLFGNGRKQRS